MNVKLSFLLSPKNAASIHERRRTKHEYFLDDCYFPCVGPVVRILNSIEMDTAYSCRHRLEMFARTTFRREDNTIWRVIRPDVWSTVRRRSVDERINSSHSYRWGYTRRQYSISATVGGCLHFDYRYSGTPCPRSTQTDSGRNIGCHDAISLRRRYCKYHSGHNKTPH